MHDTDTFVILKVFSLIIMRKNFNHHVQTYRTYC